MKTLLILTIIFSNVFACELAFKKVDLCANVKFKTTPNRKVSSDFYLVFKNSKTMKKTPVNFKVHSYLWMKMKNGHEHGTGDEKIIVKKVSPHKFLASNVWFMMLGKWQLHVHLLKDGKVIDKAMKMVKVKRGNPK